jgi:hypothetical protein
MDALTHCDLRASNLRVQCDGASDNVNYALYITCSLLIYYGIFDQIYVNRMPTG